MGENKNFGLSDLVRNAQIGGKRKSGKGQEESCRKLEEAGRGGKRWNRKKVALTLVVIGL